MAGRLFLCHFLLERSDLFASPPVFLVRLLQPAVCRFQLGVQTKEASLRLLQHDPLRLPLGCHLGEWLLKPSTLILEAALCLFLLIGSLGQPLLGHMVGRFFLRHPLLQRSDLFGGTPVFSVRLLQLASGERRLIT